MNVASLSTRVRLLFAATFFLVVGISMPVYTYYEIGRDIENVEESGLTMLQMAAQVVTENAIIGDYDTIARTLETIASRPPFEGARYIDLDGSQIKAGPQGAQSETWSWLQEFVASSLTDLSTPIAMGGRDYGVLRLSFDIRSITQGLQQSMVMGSLTALACFVMGSLVLSWSVRRWFGAVDQARANISVASDVMPTSSSVPLELRPTFAQMVETTSKLKCELELREAAMAALRNLLMESSAGQMPQDHADVKRLVQTVATMVSDLKESRTALQEARDAAEAANRAKSAFLANVSHELRTPLNAILGFTDMLLPALASDMQRHDLKAIKLSGELLLNLVNDILEFSKLETGRLELHCAAINLAALATSSLEQVAPLARQKGLNISVHVDDDLPKNIWADGDRLRQVLLNLLSNAIKFTDTGGVELTVQTTSLEGNVIRVTFAVKDTGLGIHPAMQEHIFRPFTQEDDSDGRRYGGTGLGLSISRQLVQLMGGTMSLQSVPGAGSTFFFSIDCAAADNTHAALESKALSKFATPASENVLLPENATGYILLVEDNELNRRLAERVLSRAGYAAESVCSGEDAVRLAGTRPFDAILMDVQMPGMDGITATKLIRDNELHSGGRIVPIIMMTAKTMPGDEELCLAAGATDFVSKPFRAERLLHALQQACQNSMSQLAKAGKQ